MAGILQPLSFVDLTARLEYVESGFSRIQDERGPSIALRWHSGRPTLHSKYAVAPRYGFGDIENGAAGMAGVIAQAPYSDRYSTFNRSLSLLVHHFRAERQRRVLGRSRR